MKKQQTRVLFFVTAIIIVAVLSYSMYLYQKPTISTENKKTDLSISATDFISAFESNEENANKKYLDKVVQVKGRVQEVLSDDPESLQILLQGESEMPLVACGMQAGQKEAVQKIKAGMEVIIKGQCSGMLMDVTLSECILINK